ncbi:citrulline utilization hydrolase CtlX [Parafilimonas sp.]|uniref:citrulline utilization hydrolase CtlX n=1 Tax=Parafilimonas sp. TaxID=1969739 RepID=UPI0039E6E3C2
MQNTNTILMVRPVAFAYNAETAVSNKFQAPGNAEAAQVKALEEFDAFVAKLRENDIEVTVVDDTPEPHTPDSIFPNNWISFHNGIIILYPMYAANRRAERKQAVLDMIKDKFSVTGIIDLTGYEKDNIFLEGTGSMVLDRKSKIAYACLSERTSKSALEDFCARMNYTPCSFTATDANGNLIYHTNVMMSIADAYVVICLDSIKDAKERNAVVTTIQNTGKEIMPISFEQMNRFAGNMLQLENKKGEKILVMSEQAHKSLTYEEISSLQKYNRIIYSKLDTIEMNGGGSARCMIAEVF